MTLSEQRHLYLGQQRKTNSRLRSFFGARPPSEMIVQELTSYFPSHQREDIEKTMRMSVRRSQRMSRAQSRLSVMSNVSFASSLKDAPPVPSIPNIADAWLAQTGQPARTGALRPLSVSRFPLAHMSFRDSIASSMLQPLQEESPIEPNRKSYVSFDSGSESGHRSDAPRASYFEGESPGGLTETGSLNERLSVIVAEDGEEEDTALNSFLAGNSFEKNNWMKGQWIGEGSFGSVYLALHAVTGELMAVKQVELPNHAKGTESDKKKTSMINALKVEIDLLQGLRHPHIVQYLGTSSDDTHLNIFLEYVAGGSIAGMLKQYNTFQEPLIRNFVRQILDGLSYLHGQTSFTATLKVLMSSSTTKAASRSPISVSPNAATSQHLPTNFLAPALIVLLSKAAFSGWLLRSYDKVHTRRKLTSGRWVVSSSRCSAVHGPFRIRASCRLYLPSAATRPNRVSRRRRARRRRRS